MSKMRALVAAAVIATGSLTGPAAWADYGYRRGPYHHHHNGDAWKWGAGVVLGSTLLWAATRPLPPPVVYPEPVMVAPPAYVVPPSDGWWYYCPPANAYYPYVQACPAPWQRVAPR